MAKKVMVVEDNLLNLKLFGDLLRVHRYETRPVSDGRLALDEARGFAPDLVIMDIQLPHVSGLELIAEMKADDALKSIPVMAVTAYAAVGDEDRIRAAGAEAYVSKPISVLRFVEEVRALIGEAESEPAIPPAQGEAATEPAQEQQKGDLGPTPAAPPSLDEEGPDRAQNAEAPPTAEAGEAAASSIEEPDRPPA